MKAASRLLLGALLIVTSAPAQNLATNLAENAATNVAVNAAAPPLIDSETNAAGRSPSKPAEATDLLFPPGLKSRLRLTDAQQTEVKAIERDYTQAVLEYKRANQPRIEAAQEALQKATAANDPAQLQAARAQLDLAWQGLRATRLSAIAKTKLLLTPAQAKLIDDPKVHWNGNPYNQPAAAK